MADSTTTASTGDATSAATDTNDSATGGAAEAKTRFNRAVEEAKAGVAALKGEALDRGSAYRDQAQAKAGDLQGEAKVYLDQAKDKSLALARDGKARASGALGTIGSMINDNAGTIDQRLGVQYGDYARTAAKSIQDAATKLDEKDIGELGEDVRTFVRQSPGLALGIAAVAGFMISRMFRGGGSDD